MTANRSSETGGRSQSSRSQSTGESGGLAEDFRKREESVTIASEPAGEGETHELLTLNIGPHHPATHGVLRLIATLEGEVVRDIKPIVGYVHTGIEKTCEDKSYWKVIPAVERMDYLSYYFNAMAFCGAVETLLGVEVPPRAQYLRVIHLELNRIMSHLVWLGSSALDLGAISMFWYCFHERETINDLFEMSSGQRMHTRYFQVGGVFEDIRRGFAEKLRKFTAEMPTRADEYADLLEKQEIVLQRLRGTGVVDLQTLLGLGVTGPLLRAAGNRGTCARRSRTRATTTSSSRSRSAPLGTTTTASVCVTPSCTSRRRSSTRRSKDCPRARSSHPTARLPYRRDMSSQRRWRR